MFWGTEEGKGWSGGLGQKMDPAASSPFSFVVLSKKLLSFFLYKIHGYKANEAEATADLL